MATERYQRPCLDTNVFIDFLHGASASTPRRAGIAREIFDGAEQGLYKIVASTMVVAELIRDPGTIQVTGQDLRLDAFLLQPFFVWVDVDLAVARLARSLAGQHSIRNPRDAVHLASGIRGEADCLLTADRRDMPPGVYEQLRVAEPYFPYDRPLSLDPGE